MSRWICENNCPDLIAFNLEAVHETEGLITFRCLLCGGCAGYRGPVVDDETLWRLFGGRLLEAYMQR